MRDHLFISYATEDSVFARWLALRLTACGYRVWIDQFELLGGESYPGEIDTALKARAFRFLSILSHSSVAKPNPTKERTLALNLAREREEAFLVPLNVDGLRPTELDWMTSDLTFIPFQGDWAGGLRQLLRLLERDGCPTLGDGAGPRAARDAVRADTAVVSEPETLGSNLLPILEWPDVLHQYRFTREVTSQDVLAMADQWAFHFLPANQGGRQFAFAFDDPPGNQFGDARAIRDASTVWEETEQLRGVPCWNLVKPIVIRATYLKCRQLGMREAKDGSFVYFPDALLKKNRLRFSTYTGKTVPLTVVGERSFRGKERFRYHLGFRLDLLRLPGGAPCMKISVRLRLTDLSGEELPSVAALARRKSMTRTWYNHEFYSRTLALASFLAEADGIIRCGTTKPVVLSSTPMQLQSPVSIDEERLPKGRQPFTQSRDRSASDEDTS